MSGYRNQLLALLAALLLICTAMSLLTAYDFGHRQWHAPLFLQQRNFEQIFQQSAINTVLAVGMTLVIITGGIDLSVGALAAICTVVLAQTVAHVPGGGGVVLAVAATLGAGLLVGGLNALVIVRLAAPPFIVTLGTLLICRGLAHVASGGTTVTCGTTQSVTYLVPLALPLLAVGAAWFVLSSTRFGRYVYAIGGGVEAARLSGVPVGRVLAQVYVVGGLCAALAGIIYIARMGAGDPLALEGAELSAIAATIIGGTSLSGGEGHVLGSFVGALILAVLVNGLQLLGVPPYWQRIVVGVVIVLTVCMDRYRASRRRPRPAARPA